MQIAPRTFELQTGQTLTVVSGPVVWTHQSWLCCAKAVYFKDFECVNTSHAKALLCKKLAQSTIFCVWERERFCYVRLVAMWLKEDEEYRKTWRNAIERERERRLDEEGVGGLNSDQRQSTNDSYSLSQSEQQISRCQNISLDTTAGGTRLETIDHFCMTCRRVYTYVWALRAVLHITKMVVLTCWYILAVFDCEFTRTLTGYWLTDYLESHVSSPFLSGIATTHASRSSMKNESVACHQGQGCRKTAVKLTCAWFQVGTFSGAVDLLTIETWVCRRWYKFSLCHHVGLLLTGTSSRVWRSYAASNVYSSNSGTDRIPTLSSVCELKVRVHLGFPVYHLLVPQQILRPWIESWESKIWSKSADFDFAKTLRWTLFPSPCFISPVDRRMVKWCQICLDSLTYMYLQLSKYI